jgi:uncharacterized protein Yka (UPF0111/DUF47 family)
MSTVHLEPLLPGVLALTPPMDKSMEEGIKKIISRRQDCYLQYNDGILKINVNCIFRTTGKSIEQIHEQISEVEKEIDMACPSAFVTIHTEPG